MRQNATALDHYIADIFAPEDTLLKQVAAVGESLRAGMQVSAAEGKMLHILLRIAAAKSVLEFGSFVGYSTIWMARALPPDGRLVTLEKDANHAALTRTHTSGLPVQVIEGDALLSVRDLQGPFDAIFIDGEKRRYLDYLDASLPLLRTGGLVIADNTLLFGAMVGEPLAPASAEARRVMQAFNERMADSDELSGILIPTHEGLTIAVKR